MNLTRKHILIIAEAGVNHNGDLAIAKRLVEAASDANADFVKFQTFKTDKMVSRNARKAHYQSQNVNNMDDSQHTMLQELEMPAEWHDELIRYAENMGIRFLSTAFDVESIDFLDSIGIPVFKIPSGEITNRPYLKRVAEKGKPVILSTGMAEMEEVESAIGVLEAAGLKREHLTVLHCNTQYPTPMEDVNLLAMLTMREAFRVETGYSDHTTGIEVPIAAAALGATVIEKHFTLDRNMPGPDHKASLEPNELKEMVQAIRNIEKAISGDGMKKPSPSEIPNIAVARKSIHLGRPVAKGETIRAEDLIMLRPGDGISPMKVDEVTGKRAAEDLHAGAILKWEDLE